MQRSRIDFIKLINFLQISCIIGFLVAIGLFVWLSSRSLNFQDEGWYLITARYPQAMTAIYSMWYIYTGLLFKLVGYNIIAFRYLNLLLELASLLIFAFGTYRLWIVLTGETPSQFEKVVYFSFVGMGGFVGFTVFGCTPSYNTLNSQAAYIIVGLSTYAFAKLLQGKLGYKIKILWFLAGLAFGLSFLSKFSSALDLFAIIVGGILFIPHLKIITKLEYCLYLLCGFAVWMTMHFIFLQSPSTMLHVFTNGTRLDPMGHNLRQFLNYYYELGKLSYRVLYNFRNIFFVLIGLGCWVYFKRDNKILARIMSYLPAILIIFSTILALRRQYYLGGYLNFTNESILCLDWMLWMALASVIGTYYYKTKLHFNAPTYYVVLTASALFLFFFIEAIGTSTPLYMAGLYYLAAWFVLLYAMSKILSIIFNKKWFMPINIAVISILATSQIVTSYSYPRGAVPLYQQTQVVGTGEPASQLKVDPQTANTIIQLRLVAKNCGFQPGDIILDFYNIPGLIFALGGVMPVTGWNINGTAESQAAAEATMAMMPKQQLQSAFILQDVLQKATPMPDFKRLNIVFPGHYRLCGQVSMRALPGYEDPHLFRLWKPDNQGAR